MRLTSRQATDFYKTYAWVKCRELVLNRDSYLCQVCLKDGRPTPADIVHHIKHLKDDPSKALEESNLISVCRACHGTLHSKEHKEVTHKVKVYEVIKNEARY